MAAAGSQQQQQQQPAGLLQQRPEQSGRLAARVRGDGQVCRRSVSLEFTCKDGDFFFAVLNLYLTDLFAELARCQSNLTELSRLLQSLEILQRTQSAPNFTEMQVEPIHSCLCGKKECIHVYTIPTRTGMAQLCCCLSKLGMQQYRVFCRTCKVLALHCLPKPTLSI